MIITIKGADFSTINIGTLSTWTILTTLGSGATYSGNRLVDKDGNLSATITIADGYELGSAGVSVIMGTTDVTSSASTVNGNTITISIASVTGNVTINVPTLITGEEEPEVPANSTFVAAGYRLENNVQLPSSGDPYATETKTGYHTFFDIPVNPNTVYMVTGSIRVWFMTAEKTAISTINVYTSSNVGQQYFFKTPSTAAYICITILDTKVAVDEARLVNTTVSRTVNSSVKVSTLEGVTFVDNTKLSSSSYSESSDSNYFTWKDIPVEPSTYYYLKGAARVWFLNENKTQISSVNPTTGGEIEKFDIATTATTAYMSAGFYKNNADAANDVELTKLDVQFFEAT